MKVRMPEKQSTSIVNLYNKNINPHKCRKIMKMQLYSEKYPATF
jgi:hypothetical protein